MGKSQRESIRCQTFRTYTARKTILSPVGRCRAAETISKACNEGLSAEATIDRILEAVAAFKGNAVQSDDMTCVVVRVED